MNQAIRVGSIDDEYRHLAAAGCGCGGRWRVNRQSVQRKAWPILVDRLEAACDRCGQERLFLFELNQLDKAYRADLAKAAIRESVEELEQLGSAAVEAVAVTEHPADEALRAPCPCGSPRELERVALGPELLFHLGVSCPACGAVQALVYRVPDGVRPEVQVDDLLMG